MQFEHNGLCLSLLPLHPRNNGLPPRVPGLRTGQSGEDFPQPEGHRGEESTVELRPGRLPEPPSERTGHPPTD